MNLTFFLQNVVTFLFTKLMGRFYQFPTVGHFTDTVLFCCSVVIVKWFQDNIQDGLSNDAEISEDEFKMRVLSNFGSNIDF